MNPKKKGLIFMFMRPHMQSGRLHMLPHVYSCQIVWYPMSTDFPLFKFCVKILWMMDDAITVSLDSVARAHCQSVSTCILTQAMWTSSAVVSSQPATSLCLLLSLPPQNTHTHLVTNVIWHSLFTTSFL
jgi:hypothetical protein